MSERNEIACAMQERFFEDGTRLSGHLYRDTEEHDNCHVTVSVCDNCGHVTIGWYHMDRPPVKWVEPKPGDEGEIHRRTT